MFSLARRAAPVVPVSQMSIAEIERELAALADRKHALEARFAEIHASRSNDPTQLISAFCWDARQEHAFLHRSKPVIRTEPREITVAGENVTREVLVDNNAERGERMNAIMAAAREVELMPWDDAKAVASKITEWRQTLGIRRWNFSTKEPGK
jgi:hypothetical protein